MYVRNNLLLVLAGDVETNTGPVKHPCLVCEKSVAKTHRALLCDLCEKWTHIKCSNISPSEYVEMCESEEPWLCGHCKNDFTFPFTDSFFEPETNSAVNTITSDKDDILSLHCERYDNINDSFIPAPDPEEDWDSLPAPHPESDSDHSESNGDSVLSSSYSDSEEENIDVYDQLRKLKKENKNGPILCYLNINSIRYKFDDLKEILTDKLVDMLIVAETKIDDSFNINLFKAEGYKTERRDRTAHGGGLMTFVRSDLPFKRRKDLECEEVETICYELSMSKRKWCILGAYRPPSMNNQNFESDLTKYLDKMFINYDNIICIGDLNYDLLIKEKSKPLTNICDNFNLQCMVKEPTCFTKNQTPTLIDVILTNSKTLLCNTVNFNCGLSDCHNMIATSLRESCKKNEKKKVTFRSYKNFDEAQLNDDLSRVPFQVAHTFDDVDDIYWAHELLLREVIEEHAPTKEKTPKPNPPPYMNSHYRKIINKTRQVRNILRKTIEGY